METIMKNKMGYEKEGPLLLKMSLPLVFSMLLQAMYNVVDSIFVTRLSEDALTAVSLAFPVQNLMSAIAVGTSVGMNALLSRRLGERRVEDANRAAAHGMLLEFASSLVFVLFGLFLVRPYFNIVAAGEPEIAGMGVTYLSICTTMSTAVFLQLGIEKILQGEGRTVPTMFIMATGAILNIIFDPILIFGLCGFPALGIAGAAYATVGGQIASMILGFILLYSSKMQVRLSFRGFRWEGETVKQIYSVGLPSIIMQSISTIMTLTVNKLLITYSTTAVAVFGIYFKVQSIVFMPVFGMTAASMSIIAYNFGAERRDRMMRTHWISLAAAMIYMGIGMLVFELFPGAILGIFDASEEAMAIGVKTLRILAPCFIIAAYSIVNSTLFQAVDRGFYSMAISISRQLLVLIPVAILISALTRNLDMVWLAWPIAEVASLFVTFFLYLRVKHTILDRMDAPVPRDLAD